MNIIFIVCLLLYIMNGAYYLSKQDELPIFKMFAFIFSFCGILIFYTWVMGDHMWPLF